MERVRDGLMLVPGFARRCAAVWTVCDESTHLGQLVLSVCTGLAAIATSAVRVCAVDGMYDLCLISTMPDIE